MLHEHKDIIVKAGDLIQRHEIRREDLPVMAGKKKTKAKGKNDDDDEEDEDVEEEEEEEEEEDEEDEEEEEEDDEDDEDEKKSSKKVKNAKSKKHKGKDKDEKKSKKKSKKDKEEVTHREKDLSSNPGRKGTKRWALIKALEKAGDKGSSADKVLERAKEYFKKENGKLTKDDDEKFDRIGRAGVSDLIGILREMGYKGAKKDDGKFGLVYKK
jgi:outer membrane biosynthesis protein TonB